MRKLPSRDRLLNWAWWMFFPLTALAVVRLVAEQTVLAWREGPQMVGFTALHTMGVLVVVALLGVLGLHLWVLVAGTFTLASFIRKRPNEAPEWPRLLIAVLTLGLLYVPSSAWQHGLVALFGPGEHSGRFLVSGAGSGDVGLVTKLLEAGVAVNASADGNTPLKAAATAGQSETVQLLLERGAEVDQGSGILGRTALMNAAEMGHASIVSVLISVGADLGATDSEGKTAMEIAHENGHQDIARMLAETQR